MYKLKHMGKFSQDQCLGCRAGWSFAVCLGSAIYCNREQNTPVNERKVSASTNPVALNCKGGSNLRGWGGVEGNEKLLKAEEISRNPTSFHSYEEAGNTIGKKHWE